MSSSLGGRDRGGRWFELGMQARGKGVPWGLAWRNRSPWCRAAGASWGPGRGQSGQKASAPPTVERGLGAPQE